MTGDEPYTMEYDACSVKRSGNTVTLKTKVTDSVNGTVFRYDMEIDCARLSARNTHLALYDPGSDCPYFEKDIDQPLPDIHDSFMDHFMRETCSTQQE